MTAVQQTLVLFLDALRRLRSDRLFWVALLLSTIVALLCGYVGINEQGLSFPGFGTWENGVFNSQVLPPDEFYKTIFTSFGVSIWLAYAANLLAIISTASLVPALIADGSVDLYLSRPLGRVRLFLTRYATGLLFVALQALCFSLAAMVVFGFRAGVILPGLLWTVLYVTLFFSFLYCVSALVGLLTASGVTAILLTLLFWMFVWAIDWAEFTTLVIREEAVARVDDAQRRLDRSNQIVDQMSTAGEAARASATLQQEASQRRLEDAQAGVPTISRVHDILLAVKAPLPKTGETIGELSKTLSDATDLERFEAEQAAREEQQIRDRAERLELEGEEKNDFIEAQKAEQQGVEGAVDRYYGRSAWWTFGTSLAFQGVLLSLCCWIFARRDL